ncbi:MAG: hypothetical protein ACSHX7_03730 [Luteolibacter sp.]
MKPQTRITKGRIVSLWISMAISVFVREALPSVSDCWMYRKRGF